MTVVTHREPPRLRKNGGGGGKNTPRAFPSELNRSENFYFTALPIYRGHVAKALACFPLRSVSQRYYECTTITSLFLLEDRWINFYGILNSCWKSRRLLIPLNVIFARILVFKQTIFCNIYWNYNSISSFIEAFKVMFYWRKTSINCLENYFAKQQPNIRWFCPHIFSVI